MLQKFGVGDFFNETTSSLLLSDSFGSENSLNMFFSDLVIIVLYHATHAKLC